MGVFPGEQRAGASLRFFRCTQCCFPFCAIERGVHASACVFSMFGWALFVDTASSLLLRQFGFLQFVVSFWAYYAR